MRILRIGGEIEIHNLAEPVRGYEDDLIALRADCHVSIRKRNSLPRFGTLAEWSAGWSQKL